MSIDYRMISVAMAVYNGIPYIEEQLESIRKQTRKVDEIIIVDDCSTDGTAAFICKYVKEHPECKIRLEQNETNLGYKKNFYKALSLCQGDVIFLCDQDDIWLENKVEILCDILDKHSDVGVVSSSFIQIDGKGTIGEYKKVYQRKMAENELVCVPLEDLVFHNISQGCAMAIRKEIKELFLEQFNETIPHDWSINIIAAILKKCYYLNAPLFYYRIHGKNTIGLNDDMVLKKKNTMDVRTKDALQAVKVLSFIEKLNQRFYQETPWLEEAKRFSQEHVENLENKNFIGLIRQNFNPYYRKLKTIRGRILDLFFVLNK